MLEGVLIGGIFACTALNFVMILGVIKTAKTQAERLELYQECLKTLAAQNKTLSDRINERLN